MFMLKYYPYKLVISYSGTDYSGWQRQNSEFRTVQGEIEETLLRILKHNKFSFYGSSRTDTGVHATGQVALLKLENNMNSAELLSLLNFNLPLSIRVMSLNEVASEFNPQTNLRSKEYHYYFSTEMVAAVNEPYIVKVDRAVDIDLMKQAAKLLEGVHCFESFTAEKVAGKNTVREIFKAELISAEISFQDSKIFIFKIEGSGFLKYMVRNIFAVILLVGEGVITLDQFSLLLKNSFTLNFKKAPAKGLHLFRINYSGK